MTLGYGMMLQHGRNVALQYARPHEAIVFFMAFVAFGRITYIVVAHRKVTSGHLVIETSCGQ